MEEKHIVSRSAAETEEAGAHLAKLLRPGDVIALFGGMGMGKTAFVRGLAAGLRVEDPVSSPTFALVHEHGGPVPLYHFDMYRVTGWEDLDSTGFFDYLKGEGILAIEWSENIENALPAHHLRVEIDPGSGPDERVIHITRT